MKRIFLIIAVLILSINGMQAQLQIALLKYNGGGDWYADPTALPNLIEYCNQNIKTSIFPEPSTIEIGSPEIFNFPFTHLTGHGNIILSESEALNLRLYLEGG